MKEDVSTGAVPSGPILAERLDRALGYLLNDAAQQKRGEEFDPGRLTAAKLDRLTKPQLITSVLNFAWFSRQTMLPCFRELQEQINELTTSVNENEERMVQVQADLIHSMEKVEKLQDALLIEKDNQIEALMSSVEDTVKTNDQQSNNEHPHPLKRPKTKTDQPQ